MRFARLVAVEIDLDAAFTSYEERFVHAYGDKPPGAFVKFGNHMIQRLRHEEFQERLESYLRWHKECKRALGSGSTISDALVLEFEEAAAWLVIQAPNIIEMFQGELGNAGDRVIGTETRRARRKRQ